MIKKTKTIYNLEELKKDMLKSLEENFENHFYSKYPQYKDKNLSIYAINETDEDFKDFIQNATYIHDYVIKQIERAETKKELDSIRINGNMFREAPF